MVKQRIPPLADQRPQLIHGRLPSEATTCQHDLVMGQFRFKHRCAGRGRVA